MATILNSWSSGVVQRYVDILTDAGFKAVFGDQRNKDVLIDFLNAILPEERQIKDLEYATTEIPGFALESKSVRLDLRCTGDDGTKFIVEMQRSSQYNFFKRCVEYAAKVYDSGTSRGGDYDIAPVYFIGILGEDMKFDRSNPVWKDRYVSTYNFREKETLEFAEETICINFVELYRFKKELKDCRSMVEKWCYSLKHVGKLQELPKELQIHAFERLFEACEIAKFSVEKKLQYEKDMITERDYKNILATAHDDGFEAGRTEGLAEGKAEGKIEVARTMKAKGLETALIAELTGLPEEEIMKA